MGQSGVIGVRDTIYHKHQNIETCDLPDSHKKLTDFVSQFPPIPLSYVFLDWFRYHTIFKYRGSKPGSSTALGRGSMPTVYKAIHVHSKGPTAVKQVNLATVPRDVSHNLLDF
jgi:hypothetical protein